MLGVIVVVAGEFIVGFQIVRPDFDSLGFGVTAEIDSHGRGRGSLLFAQQKRNRRSSRRIPFERLIDGATQRGKARRPPGGVSNALRFVFSNAC